MAGFRTFATGEVLTAANVNDFLMKQSVMVFADADARTAALGAEVTEGMLTFNLDTGALEVFDGSAFVPAGAEPPAGIGSNVVQTVKTDTQVISATTYQTIMSVTITPTSETSKVLLLAQINVAQTDVRYGFLQFAGGNSASYIGNVDGSRERAVFGGAGASSTGNSAEAYAMMFLDSPSSASPVTYEVVGKTTLAQQALFINRGRINADNNSAGVGASSITVIEVAA